MPFQDRNHEKICSKFQRCSIAGSKLKSILKPTAQRVEYTVHRIAAERKRKILPKKFDSGEKRFTKCPNRRKLMLDPTSSPIAIKAIPKTATDCCKDKSTLDALSPPAASLSVSFFLSSLKRDKNLMENNENRQKKSDLRSGFRRFIMFGTNVQ